MAESSSASIPQLPQLAAREGRLRQSDRDGARHRLAEMPEWAIQQDQKAGGAMVAQARAQALAWLDATWDERREMDKMTGNASVQR